MKEQPGEIKALQRVEVFDRVLLKITQCPESCSDDEKEDQEIIGKAVSKIIRNIPVIDACLSGDEISPEIENNRKTDTVQKHVTELGMP
jgi:hypothetical protein